MRIDPYEALAEYLGLQIGLRGVVRRVFEQRSLPPADGRIARVGAS